MTEQTVPKTEVLGRPLMSGHCANPQTAHPDESHARCHRQGAGSRANPTGMYHPCPCRCHFPEEEYECGNCGGVLVEAPHWPLDYDDEPEGEVRYAHVDRTGRITEGYC